MALVGGDAIKLMVETAVPGTYVEVKDMNKLNQNTQRSKTTTNVFNRATPYTRQGTRDRTYAISGLLNLTDPGQLRLRAMEAANTAVNIQVLWDGTNGFTQQVNVESFTLDADPDTWLTHGFNFSAAADSVIVGTGPLLV